MDDTDPKEVLELMIDDYAWEILACTSREPMSASELQTACDASERTIYRRLEQLESFGLVAEDLRIDPEGHHTTTYVSSLNSVHVDLDDGEYEVHIQFEEDTADRFGRIWKDIRGE